METITINKKAIADLLRAKEEFDSIAESIELMADPEFIESYSKAKEQNKQKVSA